MESFYKETSEERKIFMEEETDRKYIAKCLEDAKEYGLESEIVRFALYTMKYNEQISIREAIEDAMIEYDV